MFLIPPQLFPRDPADRPRSAIHCPHCARPFRTRDGLTRHVASRHPPKHEFVLKVTLPNPDDDPAQYLDALVEAGCGDATIGVGKKGHISLAFFREGATLQQAVLSAALAVLKAVPGAKWSVES